MIARHAFVSRFLSMFVCALLIMAGAGRVSSAQVLPSIDYAGGFTDTSALTLNGTAAVHGSAIELTDGKQFEAGSFYYNTRQNVAAFETDFDFQLTDAVAGGFTFALQTDGPDALGSEGSGLGLGIDGHQGDPFVPESFAVAFGLHSAYGDSGNSLRLMTNGYIYDEVQLGPSGIDLHSGHRFHAHIAFVPEEGGGRMHTTLTDTQTGVIYTGVLPQAQYGAVPITLFLPEDSAYVGFTGGTGEETAVQAIYNWTFTPVAVPGSPQSPGPSFVGGFTGATGLTLNGGAEVVGPALQLTHGTTFEATSAYFNEPLNPNIGFYTDFDFQIENGVGDGFTFVIQDQGLNAVGQSGGGLGYGPDRPGGTGARVGNSVAIKFDTHNNAGEGSNSVGLYYNGASPTVPSVDLNTQPVTFGTRTINLQSGHPYHVRISTVDGGLNVNIIDLEDYVVSGASFYLDNGIAIFPLQAYVGFTAGTGETPSTVKILNWTYTQGVFPASS